MPVLQKDKKCSVEECPSLVKAKGFCIVHYHRNSRYGSPYIQKYYPGRICEVSYCDKNARANDLCHQHAERLRRHGTLDLPISQKIASSLYCPYGHKMFGDNLLLEKNGYRRCKDCRQSRSHLRRQVEYSGDLISIEQLGERDNWICGICHEAVDAALQYPDLNSKSRDHIIPVSKGGLHVWKNMQLAHLVCNIRKAAK